METLAAILLIQGIALAAPVEVHSATVSSGTVKASSCFVRSSANGSSAVSFCVSSGDEVAILGEEKSKDGNTWYKISIAGSVGYIRSDLVSKSNKKINVSDSLVGGQKEKSPASPAASATPASPATPATPAAPATGGNGTGIVNGTSVRMRTTASTSSGIVTYLNTGMSVTILAEGKASDGQIWYQIKNGDQTGFVRSDLIKKAGQPEAKTPENGQETKETTTGDNEGDTKKTIEPGTGFIKGSDVNIRNAAGESGQVIGSVSSGNELTLLGLEKSGDKDWVKVSVTIGGQEVSGYILRDYIMVTKAVKLVTQTTTTQTILDVDVAANGETKPKTVSDNTGPAAKTDV